MSALPLPSISPLAQKIVRHLREHPGVVGWDEVRELASGEPGCDLFDLGEALNELRALHRVDYCHSCRNFISSTTTHVDGCPHGG